MNSIPQTIGFAILINLFGCLNSWGFQDEELLAPAETVAAADTHDDWLQYRGNGANSIQDNATFPTNWSDTEGIIWKAELPGRGSSSPIVVGNRVFVTAHTGYGVGPSDRGLKGHLRYHLICKDRNTGKTIWQRNLKGSMLTQRLNDTLLGHGFASQTPVTDGERVYVFFGATGVFAFDLDGNLIWQQNVGAQFNFFGSSASLTTYKNLLIVNASIENNTIYAFDKTTGKGVWKIDDINRCYSMPVFGKSSDGSMEMIVSEEETVHGYDPDTGQKLWHCEGIHNYTVSIPCIRDGICYCNGGINRQMMAIRLGGRGDVTETHKIWEVPMGGNVGSPIVVDQLLFLAEDFGIMGCYDVATGKRLNRFRLGKAERLYASPLLANDRILIPLRHEGIVVFEANKGMAEITRNRFATDDGPIHSSIAANGDRAFVRTPRFLYCIGESTNPPVLVPGRPKDMNQKVIKPEPRVDFVAATNQMDQYCYYLATNPVAVKMLLLAPYKSVITEAQTNQFDEIFKNNRAPFDELRVQQQEAHWAFMKQEIDRDRLDAQLEEIGKETIKHSSQVRILVKKLFTKEQMDQHLEEAAAYQKKRKQEQAEKNKNK